jgi:hypothetical protein
MQIRRVCYFESELIERFLKVANDAIALSPHFCAAVTSGRGGGVQAKVAMFHF